MMNKQINEQPFALPPLPPLPSEGMPQIHISFPSADENSMKFDSIDFRLLDNKNDTNFTVEDEILILRSLRSFFGNGYCSSNQSQVTRSFWQMFIKATNSPHSCGSLAHHWRYSMQKKYGQYLRENRLEDCIRYVESILDDRKPIQIHEKMTKNVLVHNQSHQGMPPEFKIPLQLQQQQQLQKLQNFQNLQNTQSKQNMQQNKLQSTKLSHFNSNSCRPNQPGGQLTEFNEKKLVRNFSSPMKNNSNKRLAVFPSMPDAQCLGGILEEEYL